MPRKCSFAKGKFHRIAHLLDRSPCRARRELHKKIRPVFRRSLGISLDFPKVSRFFHVFTINFSRRVPPASKRICLSVGTCAHTSRKTHPPGQNVQVLRKISSGAQKLHVCLPCFTIHGTLASVFVVLPYRALVSTPHACVKTGAFAPLPP